MNPQELVDLIDGAYSAKAEESGTEERNRCPLRLSAIGDCPRRLAKMLRGMKPSPRAGASWRVLERGTDRGARLAERLAAAFKAKHPGDRYVIEREHALWLPLFGVVDAAEAYRKIVDRFGVDGSPVGCSMAVDTGSIVKTPRMTLFLRGRADVTVLDTQEGVVDVADFKTKNCFGFSKLDGEPTDYGYAMQVCAYAAALEFKGHRLGSASLIYENQGKDRGGADDCALKAITIDWESRREEFALCVAGLCELINDFTAERSANRARAAYAEAVLNNDGGPLPWQCNYCAIGPERGECAPSVRLIDKRRAGAAVPAWNLTAGVAV